MNEELVPLSEAKIRLHELVRGLPERDVLLLRHGRPAGIMLDIDAYRELLRRIEDLEDRLAVYESREEGADVRVPWDKIKADTGLGTD
jgi:PHD/YefM family antitoxin component YafN of YafNO toxin-antitoxin module